MIKLIDLIPVSSGLQYHLEKKIPLVDNVYRYSSSKFVELFSECRDLHGKGQILLEDFDLELIEKTDLGLYGYYNSEKVPLDLPLIEEVVSQYKGRDVVLDSPKRSTEKGQKKFYVYVKNPDSGKVIKVRFGAKDGGQNLSVKVDDPEARRLFGIRHGCDKCNDKTTPCFWSCRVNRYWTLLGGKRNYPGWW